MLNSNRSGIIAPYRSCGIFSIISTVPVAVRNGIGCGYGDINSNLCYSNVSEKIENLI